MKTDAAMLRTFVTGSFHMLYWNVLRFEQQGSILSGDKEFLPYPLRSDLAYLVWNSPSTQPAYCKTHHITKQRHARMLSTVNNQKNPYTKYDLKMNCTGRNTSQYSDIVLL